SKETFDGKGFLWNGSGPRDTDTDRPAGPVHAESHLHGSASNRKITRHALEFNISPRGAAVRQRKDNLGEDLIGFKRGRISERKEISRRDHSFASWTTAFQLRVEGQNYGPVIARRIRLHQSTT